MLYLQSSDLYSISMPNFKCQKQLEVPLVFAMKIQATLYSHSQSTGDGEWV